MLVLQTVQIAKVMPMTCTTTALQTQCRHHLNHDQAEAGKTPKFFVANGMPSTFTDSPIQERKLRQAAGEGDLLSGLPDELGYWSAARWPLQGRFRLGAAKCPEGRAPCESPRLRGALLPGCICAQRYDLVPIAFTTWFALKAKIQQDILGDQDSSEAHSAGELVSLLKTANQQSRLLARGLDPIAVELHGVISGFTYSVGTVRCSGLVKFAL